MLNPSPPFLVPLSVLRSAPLPMPLPAPECPRWFDQTFFFFTQKKLTADFAILRA
jgi:hypothetical protein